MKFIKLELIILFNAFSLCERETLLKDIDSKTYIKRTLITAGVGVSCEVAFTSLYNFFETKETHLMGHSYLWMIALYSLIYPTYRKVFPKVAHLHSLYRYSIYTSMIYSGEYFGGRLLRKFIGAAPWEKFYHDKAWAIDDLIRLDYAPVWFLAASIFEETCCVIDE